MRRTAGLTIVELLIALAIIAVAFAALGFAQLTSLRASSHSKLASEAKTAAADKLESLDSQILKVVDASTSSSYTDRSYPDPSTGGTTYESFYFIDYYYSCPSVISSSYWATSTRTALRGVACTGSSSKTVQDGTIGTNWSIKGETGPNGEGVIDITVTSTHSAGPSVTVSDRLSCYDVYPSPTIDVPAPCPVPTQAGGGRPSS